MRSTCRNNQPVQMCHSDPLASFPIAMAYVPWQNFGTLYDPEKALMAGTLFPELDKPFVGRRAFRR